MRNFCLRAGLDFDWKGTPFRVSRLLPNGDALLERIADGHVIILDRPTFLAEYSLGSIGLKPVPGEPTTRKLKFSRPLDELPEARKKEALRRWSYVKAILESQCRLSKSHPLPPLIAQVGACINDPNPPARATLCRWIQRYRRHQDTRALIPRMDLRGPNQLRQSPKVQEFVSEATAAAFAASPQANVPGIHTRLVAKIKEFNRCSPIEQLKSPSERTLYRMLGRLDAFDIAVLKEGRRLAGNRFRIAGAGVLTTHILQRAEIDHTPLDLFLIDELTWLPLGRPTLTVILDHYSRMPLSYYLSFGSPSVAAVMGALRHALLPKQPAAQVLSAVKTNHAWVCYGIPDVAALDNGLEFLSQDLEGVAFDLGIHLLFCPKKSPWFKGRIERYLKTINYFFAHQMPGTSFSRFDKRGDYDPQKHAILTLAEFKQFFEKWILDIYSQSIHEGIGTTPWAKWHDGLNQRQPTLPADVRTLQRRIGHVTERSLRRDGIQLNGIRYNSGAVADLLRIWGEGVKVRVVFDSENLGEIQIWPPETQTSVAIAAVDYAYANGLTLTQNKLIQTQLREQGRAAVNKDELQAAKHELAQAVAQLMQSRKQGKRRQAAAIRAMTSNNPQADLLGKPAARISRVRTRTKSSNAVVDAMPIPAYAAFRLGEGAAPNE
jgi:putative transposase